MAAETELEAARNETWRKIGRNLVKVQRLERMLKLSIVHSKLQLYTSNSMVGPEKSLADLERRSAAVNKKTMGNLVGEFLAETFITQEVADGAPSEVEYFRFTFQVDTASHEARKKALASIVAERNYLVHHFTADFDFNSVADCRAASQYLDLQHEKIAAECEWLKGFFREWDEARKRYAAFLASDEGKRQFKLAWLRASLLAELLADGPAQAARTDGWTVLDHAAQLLRQQAPEDLATLHERYGYKTLKQMMLATDLFDFCEEPTAKGGIRVLYRLKPGVTATLVDNDICLQREIGLD